MPPLEKLQIPSLVYTAPLPADPEQIVEFDEWTASNVIILHNHWASKTNLFFLMLQSFNICHRAFSMGNLSSLHRCRRVSCTCVRTCWSFLHVEREFLVSRQPYGLVLEMFGEKIQPANSWDTCLEPGISCAVPDLKGKTLLRTETQRDAQPGIELSFFRRLLKK